MDCEESLQKGFKVGGQVEGSASNCRSSEKADAEGGTGLTVTPNATLEGLNLNPTPIGAGWVEFEKYQEVNRQLAEKEEENKELRKWLRRFRKHYPKFDGQMEELLKLKKELRTNTRLIEELKTMIDQANQEFLRKEEEIGSLTRRIAKHKLGEHERGRKETSVESWSGNGARGKDAASIFPEEVWALIFANLSDFKDRWACSNTCSLFKKILHDWKAPTLVFKSVFPYLFQRLRQHEILELRLVSKGWNRVVDQFLETHPPLDGDAHDSELLPLPIIPPMEQKRLYRLNRFDFREESDAKVVDPEDPGFPYVPGRNPFLGRSVTLILNMISSTECTTYGDSDYFECDGDCLDDHDRAIEDATDWDGIYSFLRKFGKHIWYLTLDSSGAPEEEGHHTDTIHDHEMFQFLSVDMASLLPNLRKLRILPHDLEEYFAIDVFPPVPKLESVSLESAYSGHEIAAELIKKNHSTLRSLCLGGNLWSQFWLWNLDWPNLTELHIYQLHHVEDLVQLFCSERERRGGGYWSREKIKDFGGIRMPLLRKLGVNLRGLENGCDWLLLAIHKLFSTTQLTTLRVCGGIGPKMFKGLWWPFCMSPTLKTLEVEHGRGGGAGFYNFLIHFPLVENIHLFSRKEPEPRRMPGLGCSWDPAQGYAGEEGVDVYIHLEDGSMYESNIWELLPRLKLFTFKWDRFTRAGYEEFKKGKQNRAVDSRRDKIKLN